VAFLVVLALLVALTVALYNKSFTKVVRVTLETDRIGNQLSAPADVKLRGLVVGEVRSVSSKGDGATVKLALDPDKAKLIPADVTAQLLPKTLFGEKYVLLSAPYPAAGRHLQAGDVIPQDRTATALETERVIDDLMPLLQSLKPAELSMTLNGLATALRDRGDRLGRNLTQAGAYFARLNPSLPTLAQDMQGLADFSNSTADATPALLEVLDNLSASSRNLVDERAALDAFLASTGTFADSARTIVADNQQRLVSLARDSLPSLNLYARYSPEFPCFFAGLAAYNPIIERAFGKGQSGLHITVEAIQDQGGYAPGQEPKYRDTRAPYCEGLPHPKVPAGDESFDDGYRTSTTPSTAAAAAYLAPTSPSAASDLAMDTVAAPVLGVRVDQVPDIVSLLFGPLARGNSVGLA
jgi:virulence factor Mce-like protein